MNRGFALTIGLLAMLAPAIARAQTNLDQGKSASQLFAGACADCHKAPHTLAKGKNAATVADFLREHYTTGREQAAALAAYVVSGRDTVASPVPGRRPATAVTGQRPPKPDEAATANAKPRRPAEETTSGGSMINPVVRSEPAVHETKPATASRNRRKETAPADVPQEPAAVAHAPAESVPETARPEPAAQEPPTATVAPTAAAPAAAAEPAETPATESGEPAARDNIPD